MSGTLIGRTARNKLALFNAQARSWHTEMNNNMAIIDGLLYAATGITGITNVWQNNTTYVVGDTVIDQSTGDVYVNNVEHTSVTNNTFEGDRISNPTYWTNITAPRIEWNKISDTTYTVLDTDWENKGLASTSASATTFTVPEISASFNPPEGIAIPIVQYGAGILAVAAVNSNVTINGVAGASIVMEAQYRAATLSLFDVTNEEWLLLGSVI